MAGQINRQSGFGELVFNFACKKEIKTILEVGTWNGEGSTKCFLDGLLTRDDDWQFYSVESNQDLHEQAKRFWRNHFSPEDSGNPNAIPKNVHLINGIIVDKEDIMTLEEIRSSPHYKPELENYWSYESSQVNGRPNIFDTLPEQFDLILLDGGEFSTRAEFNKLKDSTKYFLLDDTNMMKCYDIVEELNESPEWECIINDKQERNGFAAFGRIDL